MATINYLNVPGGPTTTAPSAPLQNQNSVVGTIQFANADTQIFITHNLGLQTSDISQGWPMTDYRSIALSAFGASYAGVTSAPQPYVVSQATAFTVMNKANSTLGGDTVPQFQFVIARPHSIFR